MVASIGAGTTAALGSEASVSSSLVAAVLGDMVPIIPVVPDAHAGSQLVHESVVQPRPRPSAVTRPAR